MSLLLDALKRAEDAKRAKASAAASTSNPTNELPTSDQTALDDNGPITEAPPLPPSVSSSDITAYPTLSLEEIDTRPSDPVAQSNSNPASTHSVFATRIAAKPPAVTATAGRATTAIRSLDIADTESPIKPIPRSTQPREASPADVLASTLSVDEVALAKLLQNDISASKFATPTAAAATAAFRAARSNLALQSDTKAPSQPSEAKATMPSASSATKSTIATLSVEAAAALVINTDKREADTQVQVARDAVKNAFAAKTAARTSSKPKWALPVVAIVLFAVGLGGWYVWQEINRTNRASPMAAQNTQSASTPSASPPSPTTSSPSQTSTTASQPTTAPVISEDVLPPLLPPLATELPVIKSAKPVSAVAEVTFTPREAFANQIEALPKPPASVVKLSPAATPRVNSINPSLASGYAALNSGDYEKAKRFYAEAIAADATSVDANLGFATAAARSGSSADLATAERAYRRVLEIDPRNATAASALLVLSNNASAGEATQNNDAENELRLLVNRDPTVAASHFALGNVYAANRRWREAQQSYFEAARIAPQNSDYAYNLAVSLDQLGQLKQAEQFYRRALALPGRAQFDRATVEQRLAAINRQLEKQ
jgi:Tfp pilus assembly protein PilF